MVDSPINMETFENAVHRWFSESTELQTIWAYQAKTMPQSPVGVLQIIAGPVTAAPQFEVRDSTDLNRPDGFEVEQIACVPCTFTVSCQVWVSGDDRFHPHGNARFYLSKALGALGLPSYQAVLKASEVSVVRTNSIEDIPSVQEDAFVSRVNMDIVFGASLNVVEYTTYIQKIQGTGTFEGTDIEIDSEFGDI